MNDRAAPPRREPPGSKASAALTVAVHLGLALFLFFGIRWQSQPPASLEVELASAPPSAAPPAAAPEPATRPEPKPQAKPEPRPEPKPEPRPEPQPEPKPVVPPKAAPAPEPKPQPKPEIATKAPEKKPEPKKPEPKPEPPRPEPKKPEPKKPEPPKPETKPPEPKAQAKPLEPAPPDYLKQQLEQERKRAEAARREQEAKQAEQARLAGMLNADAARASAASTRGNFDKYKLAIQQKVRGNLLRPPGLSGNPEAVFEVDQLPSGEVLAIRLKRSSGIPALDDAIERSIRRSSPLPLPEQRDLFQRTLELRFRPLED